jgi:indole-3-glycerol phosphate synthase
MSDALDRICALRRRDVAARAARLPAAWLEARVATLPPPRGFAAALARAARPGRPALIAEIKKASPSKGLIRADFDPPVLARAYEAGGAAALSVLTEGPHFQGRDEDLVAARAAVCLPALRKDFVLDPYQILESRALGADCVLLIMAALDPSTCGALYRLARDLGLDVLAEVHDPLELDMALALDGALLGVNNRDLRSLRVDLATFERLAARAPAGRFLVAESGIASAADVARVAAAGAQAMLVGESLMRQADLEAATRAQLGTPETGA